MRNFFIAIAVMLACLVSLSSCSSLGEIGEGMKDLAEEVKNS